MFLLFVARHGGSAERSRIRCVWIGLYGIAAVAERAGGARSRVPVPGSRPSALCHLSWPASSTCLPSLPDTSLDAFSSVGMSGERDELVRELWGLIICAVWTGVLLATQRRGSGDAARPPGA